MFYAYIYRNPITDEPFYVGKGTANRAYTHLTYKSKQKRVIGRIRNLRERSIEPLLEIYHATNEVAAFWLERCFIAAYGRKDKQTGCLLNHTDGGEGLHNPSIEARKKMSNAHKGKSLTQEHRSKVSMALMGIVRSEEHRRKISQNNGMKTLESRAKISAANKNPSQETRLKIGASKKGKTWIRDPNTGKRKLAGVEAK